MSRFVALVLASVLIRPSPASAGPIHVEFAAGNIPVTAEVVNVPVTHIQGRLWGGAQRGGGPVDFEDVYAIYITDTNPDGSSCAFSASTTWFVAAGGVNDFDTQLWLFDASANGLLGNDDVALGTPQSLITFPSTDTTATAFPGPGFYYLAISGGDGVAGGGGGDDPASVGGTLFDFTDLPDAFQISGADGPGGASPFSVWSATGAGATGSYDILLSCVTPEPATCGMLVLPAFLLISRRRSSSRT